MKKLFALAALTLTTTATAQKALTCDTTALFSYASKISLEAGLDDTFGSAWITKPATFPNPAKTSSVAGPFRMKCPTFTASSTATSLRLDGPLTTTFRKITPPFRDGEVDPEGLVKRVVLAFEGDYLYPNLGMDWRQERVFLDLQGGRLKVIHDGSKTFPFLDNTAIGVKVNGGPLTPVFFQDKVTQVKHDGNDLVEFFLQGDAAAFDYAAFDFGKNMIVFKNGVPFPKK